MIDWKGYCQRCYQETNDYDCTKSFLNTHMVCIECSEQSSVVAWMNKKVERSPYYLATLGGVIIPLVISTVLMFFNTGQGGPVQALERFHAGDTGPIFILLGAIIIVSPIGEELIFRKFLWWVSSMLIPPNMTLFIISVLFAAMHGSPSHAIAILPLSFFIGWFRLKTGSIKPCIVAHAVNNAVASAFYFV